jgi:hypothetical protein
MGPTITRTTMDPLITALPREAPLTRPQEGLEASLRQVRNKVCIERLNNGKDFALVTY